MFNFANPKAARVWEDMRDKHDKQRKAEDGPVQRAAAAVAAAAEEVERQSAGGTPSSRSEFMSSRSEVPVGAAPSTADPLPSSSRPPPVSTGTAAAVTAAAAAAPAPVAKPRASPPRQVSPPRQPVTSQAAKDAPLAPGQLAPTPEDQALWDIMADRENRRSMTYFTLGKDPHQEAPHALCTSRERCSRHRCAV
jgi:hypothetical protein